MEAQEQKHLQAKQSAVLFSQHHQIHLVCVMAVRNPHWPKLQRKQDLKLRASYLPLSAPAETREKKRRGAAEEGVGGQRAGENPGQIKILQRGQALLLSHHLPAKLQRLVLFITSPHN